MLFDLPTKTETEANPPIYDELTHFAHISFAFVRFTYVADKFDP
jgi:hypothetical protein